MRKGAGVASDSGLGSPARRKHPTISINVYTVSN